MRSTSAGKEDDEEDSEDDDDEGKDDEDGDGGRAGSRTQPSRRLSVDPGPNFFLTISSFHIWNTPGNLAANGNILMRILHTIAKSAPRVRPKIFGQADSSACRGLPPF